MRHSITASIRCARILLSAALFCAESGFAQSAKEQSGPSPDQKERQSCSDHLVLLYEAIQAFRKDHKELPNWLSDLVPQYLPNTNALICPITKRTGRKHSLEEFVDPRIATSYIYQFSAAPALGSFDPLENMSHADVKRLQMALVGGGTPILSCSLHAGGWMHVSFDGQPFETKDQWEARYFEVVSGPELYSARRMAAKFGKALEPLATSTETNRSARAKNESKESSEAGSSIEVPRNWPWWAYALGGGGGFYLFAAGILKLVFGLRKSSS